MTKSPLTGLTIRTAIVRKSDLGFIYACDLAKEQQEIPHVIVFKWKSGVYVRFDSENNAHTACMIHKPEVGLLHLSSAGYYAINTQSGLTSGNILDDGRPPGKNTRIGGFRVVSEIEGKAFAVGYGGMVYRLDELKKWTRIDEGLPVGFDIDAIDGFSDRDIYAAGLHGILWCYNGITWTQDDLPTNKNLSCVKCAGDGNVYIGGDDGTLLMGRDGQWRILDSENMTDDIWDLEWFEGNLYVSTMSNVYCLVDEKLLPVEFGDDVPKTCYQLSATEGVMWSNGEHDIMSFDGSNWTRIV